MKTYKKIHLQDFPKTITVMLEEKFRKKFVRDFIDSFNTWKQAVSYLNKQNSKYNIKTKISVGALSHWFYGIEKRRGKTRRMPLWAVIEISKNINVTIDKIENNLIEICTTGRGTPIKIKFPIYLTPELVSIAFHLLGDGHLAGKGQQSHYRQTNKEGLSNFKQKLINCFGEFSISISENSKIAIPRAISIFLEEYLNLGNCYWDKSKINNKIKNLPNEFLLAGLNAFIVDEGHIGDSIEIYSGNKKLLENIVEIMNKLDYTNCGVTKKREKNGMMYRTRISLESAQKYFKDCNKLTQNFSTCGLAHKERLLENIIRRQTRSWKTRKNGETKTLILKLLKKQSLNSKELRVKLNICGATLREHLKKLEQDNLITKTKPHHSCCLLWSKIE